MPSTAASTVKGVTLIILALAMGAMGIYVGEVDDAPGAGGLAMILMAAGVVLGVRAARNRLSTWAARTAIAVGVVLAAFVAVFTHGITVTQPLFAQPSAVPSVVGTAPAPKYAAAVERARELVRAAILEQNLPGVSVAVGAGGTLVWTEAFGLRDVVTRTPMTPATRFVIGTASSVIAPAVASLGLKDTGSDAATEWSPEHIGEPEEDFPGFTLLRHVICQPLGWMPTEYPLPGERATFYVPRSDDNPRRGRDLMYMRDLACCDAKAFYSTPSDLLRVAMAANVGSVEGSLAGGPVMSLMAPPERGVVVSVASNIAHAATASLAARVSDAFGAPSR